MKVFFVYYVTNVTMLVLFVSAYCAGFVIFIYFIVVQVRCFNLF
jgi:hypothetical protein